MPAALPRTLAGAVLGALAGPSVLALMFALEPGVAIDMYRDLPRGVAAGFYPVERAGEQPFAWTGRSASVRFAGMRRSDPWDCVVRFRGGRADLASLPDVEVAIDGIVAGRRVASNDYEDLVVRADPMPRAGGLTLTITSSNVFVPGPGDPRELGIQVGHIGCRPADQARVLPPGRALRHATAAAVVLGAGIGWAGVPALWGLLLGLVVVLGQAFLLSTGLGPYGPYPGRVVWFALGVAVAWFALLAPLGRGATAESHRARFGAALSQPARFVVLLAGAVFYLKVLGLLHPGKAIIDAVFHANRLQWVLDGRFYFTQPMPGGVSFPYAIGLYVFAAPWTVLTSDYVTLLRVIVTAAEVTAGALLYFLVARVWSDRLVAVLAVLFFHAVPLPYGILGNANLTNVFGQATALVALVAAALLVPRWWRLVSFFAVCLLAFLSHISTFAVLAVTLVALAAWFWLLGGRELRRVGVMILAAAAIAGVVSVAVYYGHFGEVYATALRSRTEAAAPAQPGAELGAAPARATSPIGARLVRSARLTTSELGWPLLILGALGILHLVRAGARDRLGLLLAAYGVAYVVFFGFGVSARVDPAMERYATEFVGRVNLAAYPALAILAARGAAWAWRSGLAGQLAAAALIGSALRVGVMHWRGWIG